MDAAELCGASKPILDISPLIRKHSKNAKVGESIIVRATGQIGNFRSAAACAFVCHLHKATIGRPVAEYLELVSHGWPRSIT